MNMGWTQTVWNGYQQTTKESYIQSLLYCIALNFVLLLHLLLFIIPEMAHYCVGVAPLTQVTHVRDKKSNI